MQWYDYPIIVGIVVGLFLILFGSYHDSGTKKSGIWGWIIIIFLLIVRALIWIGSTI